MTGLSESMLGFLRMIDRAGGKPVSTSPQTGRTGKALEDRGLVKLEWFWRNGSPRYPVGYVLTDAGREVLS